MTTISPRLLLAGAVLLLSSCLTTPIRRSAFVPRNTIPANHGTPIGNGGMKAFAQINTFEFDFGSPVETIDDLFGQIPTEGAAGLFIPKLHVGGGVYGAPNDFLEVGAHVSYTHLSWAEPNLIGVLDFPEEHKDQPIIMGGPGVRFNIPAGEQTLFVPAVILEANLATVPQAVFVRQGNTTVNPDGSLNVPAYEFQRIDRKTFILPKVALHASIMPIEYVGVVLMGGIDRGVKNIGFDPDIDNLENDTLKGYFYGFFGGGIEGRYSSVFATFVLTGAVGQPQEIRFGLSGAASLGVVFL